MSQLLRLTEQWPFYRMTALEPMRRQSPVSERTFSGMLDHFQAVGIAVLE